MHRELKQKLRNAAWCSKVFESSGQYKQALHWLQRVVYGMHTQRIIIWYQYKHVQFLTMYTVLHSHVYILYTGKTTWLQVCRYTAHAGFFSSYPKAGTLVTSTVAPRDDIAGIRQAARESLLEAPIYHHFYHHWYFLCSLLLVFSHLHWHFLWLVFDTSWHRVSVLFVTCVSLSIETSRTCGAFGHSM